MRWLCRHEVLGFQPSRRPCEQELAGVDGGVVHKCGGRQGCSSQDDSEQSLTADGRDGHIPCQSKVRRKEASFLDIPSLFNKRILGQFE